MDLAVHAHVAAVDVAVEVFAEEGVVEGGVEDDLLVVGAAFDLDFVEGVVPCSVRFRAHGVEGGAGWVFGAEIGFGVLRADVGDGDADVDGGRARGVENEPSAGAFAGGDESFVTIGRAAGGLGRVGADGGVLPCAGAEDGRVEVRDEVEGVVAAAVSGAEISAEVAAGDGAGDGAIGGVNIDVGVAAAGLGVGGAHEHDGWFACGVGESSGASAERCGEFGGDAVRELDLVVAGLCGLVVVGEGAAVDLGAEVVGGRGSDFTGVGHEGNVAAGAGATGAHEVGEGEATDAVGGVLVAAGSCGAAGVVAHGAGYAFDLLARAVARLLGAPRKHAEGQGGAGIVVAAVGGADERINERGGSCCGALLRPRGFSGHH